MKVNPGSILIVLALTAIAVFGQDKKTEAPKPAPAPAATTAPKPSDLETAKLENLQLRMALLQDEERSLPQRKGEIQQAYGVLIQQIEKEHPGFTWNPQMSALVPTPKPATKPTPAAEVKK